MGRKFTIIALTLPGFPDPSVAIAASRAGALGILDLEFIQDIGSSLQSAASLARHAKGEYGFKLHCQQTELLLDLINQNFDNLSTVILTGDDPQRLQQLVELIHSRELEVFFEATSLAQAWLGEQLGVDGIVAKGSEAGGRVGEETAFVLTQSLLNRASLPIFTQGGIGYHTAAACYAAGVSGVVLDAQLALTRESRLPEKVKARIAVMDGSETLCLGEELGECFRIYAAPGLSAVDALREEIEVQFSKKASAEETRSEWVDHIRKRIGWDDPVRDVLLLGQEAAFAAPLAQRHFTVGGVVSAIRNTLDSHFDQALRTRPLGEGAPLAKSIGTRYPILQGPMTRVSDKSDFALAVAKAGGLPFLALSLMKKTEVASLLRETQEKLEGRPWGVGILGFVPQAVRQEQLEAIKTVRPGFALIAGGRPDQATLLEREGIPTYLHVPSPGLLKMFLAEGSKHFVFEGQECGGHVGPRSSFVLWETMVEVLLEHLSSTDVNPLDFHVVFAGGIHDSLSSSIVSVLAAPLADLGVQMGVLMGTAYLFTQEAVATGAIVPGYQQEAIQSDRTVLLQTGAGHITRCLDTPYIHTFVEKKRHLMQENVSGDRIREELEELNLGRLRIASKGITRHADYGKDPQAPKFVNLGREEQRQQGMYMIGQVASLRGEVTTMEALHRDVSSMGSARLETFVEKRPAELARSTVPEPSKIAIVGMSCILPGAKDVQTFWENILNKVDAITEVPAGRWDWRRYFDADRFAKDKINSRWGGFIEDVPFDPLEYGMVPNSIPSIDPVQLLMLEAVRSALADAGYLERPFPRERTSVTVAVGGGLGDLGYHYAFRAQLPHFIDPESSEVIERLSDSLPEWTEDSFAGILLSVVAGRIANRFNLGGPNFIVDAACGSSLAALDVAIKDLCDHRTDMAIVGAGDTVQSPFGFLAFSKTQALSPTGRCRPFDADADGIAISEGLAVLVLKRLEDAEKDGDHIYAVIQGIGASSDGKARGLTAPRAEGQLRALRRAYAQSGIAPGEVTLIEAHGTGTKVGDPVEVEALNAILQEQAGPRYKCGIGSVKSMIGHTKSTAGLAGLIKVVKGLYHQVLPPTLISKPNPKIDFSPNSIYINSEARPWLTDSPEQVRRAGVSAFGFGGTNFHAIVEEYRDRYLPPRDGLRTWPAQLFVLQGADRARLLARITELESWLSAENEPPLRDLAYSVNSEYQRSSENGRAPEGKVVAVIASSLEDLRKKLVSARSGLEAGESTIMDPRGIYFTEQPLAQDGKIAFLYPGQGSQYPNMLIDLVLNFPEVSACFERANHILKDRFPQPLSDYVFPVPVFSPEQELENRQALTTTYIAQPALGAADLAVSGLFRQIGAIPDFVAGHSYGEIVALHHAGVIGERDMFLLSEARGRFMAQVTGPEAGTMAAARASRESVRDAINGLEDLTLANLNSPSQTVISGPKKTVEKALQTLKAKGIYTQILPVACAFHSPLVAPARELLADFLKSIPFKEPKISVYSNSMAGPYPQDSKAIKGILSDHLVRPVDFQGEVEALYAAGTRIFVESGPRNVLSALVGQILEGRPHLAVSPDAPGGSALVGFLKAVGQLAAYGASIRLAPLYDVQGLRGATQIDFRQPYKPPEQAKFRPTTWMVNGGRARPWAEGQEHASELSSPSLKVRLVKEEMPPARVRKHTDAEMGSQTQPPGDALQPSPSVPSTAPVEPAASQPTIRADEGMDDEVSQMMFQHHQLMSRFLEVQKEIMLTFLGGESASDTHVPLVPDFEDRFGPDIAGDQFPATSPIDALSQKEASEVDLQDQEPQTKLSPEAPQQPIKKVEPSGKTDSMLDRDRLTAELVGLVSERTGYPPKMLDPEADLEADLGIDSIKRVEILGSFRERHLQFKELMSGERMEELQTLRSLHAIADWVMTKADRRAPPTSQPSSPTQELGHATDPEEAPESEESIQRFLLSSVEIPLRESPASIAPGRAVLITDDSQGVAETVATQLRQQGHKTILVTPGQEVNEIDSDAYIVDLTNPKSVNTLLDLVRERYGTIGGLLHLAPLRSQGSESLEPEIWHHTLRQEVSGLFYLIQGLHDDLMDSAQAGGACLLGVTDMGGSFASQNGRQNEPFLPVRGGILGLLKTAAKELPMVRVKAIDFDTHLKPARIAKAVLDELSVDDGLIEVGYEGASRIGLEMVPAPLEKKSESLFGDSTQPVLLITGGARGITAAVAQEFADRYKPTLLLVGRSPPPPPEESSRTESLHTPQSIRRALIESLSKEGGKVPLAEVESVYNRLMREREMRASMASMKAAGASVHYHQVDVRNKVAFGSLIDDIYRIYGRLDGVIHGAGVIEDKLIKDKTPASFDRVIRTKLDGAFTLARKLRPDELRFLVFFSSVSGRFGNKGQGDYAAANEVLNKLAVYLDQRWQGRVVSINWGPWDSPGMVSPELRREFQRRGVSLVPPATGRRKLIEELLGGQKGDVEVIVCGGEKWI